MASVYFVTYVSYPSEIARSQTKLNHYLFHYKWARQLLSTGDASETVHKRNKTEKIKLSRNYLQQRDSYFLQNKQNQ